MIGGCPDERLRWRRPGRGAGGVKNAKEDGSGRGHNIIIALVQSGVDTGCWLIEEVSKVVGACLVLVIIIFLRDVSAVTSYLHLNHIVGYNDNGDENIAYHPQRRDVLNPALFM